MVPNKLCRVAIDRGHVELFGHLEHRWSLLKPRFNRPNAVEGNVSHRCGANEDRSDQTDRWHDQRFALHEPEKDSVESQRCHNCDSMNRLGLHCDVTDPQGHSQPEQSRSDATDECRAVSQGARNFTQCDSLLIGDQCGAHTVPYIESNTPSAQFEHEATTSKLSDDQLFYCRQRGLSEEDAVALLVNGFCREVLQELPMEFAVEAQKLVAISLEGSVG